MTDTPNTERVHWSTAVAHGLTVWTANMGTSTAVSAERCGRQITTEAGWSCSPDADGMVHVVRLSTPEADAMPGEQEYATTIVDPAGGWGLSVFGYGQHPDGWLAVAARIGTATEPATPSPAENRRPEPCENYLDDHDPYPYTGEQESGRCDNCGWPKDEHPDSATGPNGNLLRSATMVQVRRSTPIPAPLAVADVDRLSTEVGP